jgi:hypothetical protein
MDVAAAEQHILDAGDTLVARHREVGAVQLECTNMVPYAKALRDRLQLLVYDIYSLVTWFHAGLSPRDFAAPQGSGGSGEKPAHTHTRPRHQGGGSSLTPLAQLSRRQSTPASKAAAAR